MKHDAGRPNDRRHRPWRFQEEIDARDDALAALLGPLERTLDAIFVVHVLVEFRTAYVDVEQVGDVMTMVATMTPLR